MVWNGTSYGTYLVEQFSTRQRYFGCSPPPPGAGQLLADKLLGCQGKGKLKRKAAPGKAYNPHRYGRRKKVTLHLPHSGLRRKVRRTVELVPR